MSLIREGPDVRRVLRGERGLYFATRDGRVLSERLAGEMALDRGGRVMVGGRWYSAAYLVARAFVPNPEARPWVVHLNGDRGDNRAANLAWSEVRESQRTPRRGYRRPFARFAPDGARLDVWESAAEASRRTGVGVRGIRECLAGRRRTSGGYCWAWL